MFATLASHYYLCFVFECLFWSQPLDSHRTVHVMGIYHSNKNCSKHYPIALNHLLSTYFVHICTCCHSFGFELAFDCIGGFGGCNCVGFRCREGSRIRGRYAARSTLANRSPKSALYPECVATLSNYPAQHLAQCLSPWDCFWECWTNRLFMIIGVHPYDSQYRASVDC